MKELNLLRLMNNCCVEIDINVFDELFDYLIKRVDLNTVNIDNIYVNKVYIVNKEMMKDIGSGYDFLSKVGDTYYPIDARDKDWMK